jgi:hypothetical protein
MHSWQAAFDANDGMVAGKRKTLMVSKMLTLEQAQTVSIAYQTQKDMIQRRGGESKSIAGGHDVD